MKQNKTVQDRFLETCYTHTIGRILLRPFVGETFSRWMGVLLDHKCSTVIIPFYKKVLKIDMSDVKKSKFDSFNDFFKRELNVKARPFADEVEAFPSPCDGNIMVLPINSESYFNVKHTTYSLRDLFHSEKLAKEYEGGVALMIRLTVSDYHRYCYSVSGVKSCNRKIQGIYHTVNPIANDYVPVYKTNTRQYTRIMSPIYGPVIQMEVGALCVGRIVNHDEKAKVQSGKEKGYFEFGGSTVIVFLKKDTVKIREDLIQASKRGEEVWIKMGEAIGEPIREV